MTTIHPNVSVTPEQIAAFCQKWQIVRFELFGSVLRDDFGPESDVDVLVTFAEGSEQRIADLIAMDEEAAALFGRPVDLVKRKLIEKSRNWIRRRHILSTARPIYAV